MASTTVLLRAGTGAGKEGNWKGERVLGGTDKGEGYSQQLEKTYAVGKGCVVR